MGNSRSNRLSWTTAISRVLGAGVLAGTVGAGLFAMPAFAQQAGSRAATTGPDQIQDVVVTARRVGENIQKVPVEVVAVSGEALKRQGIKRLEDLSTSVPGFTAQDSYQAGVPVYSIRGQHGDDNPLPDTEPAVAVYFAGMNTSRAEGTNSAFFDLDSVQVLEGPQGTLFGRNSTGGAILITPKAPEPTFGGYVQAGYGNYNDRTFEGALNIPIVSDKVDLRIAGTDTQRDGYIQNIANNTWGGGVDENSERVSLLLKPNEVIQSTFIGTFYKSNTSGDTVKLDAVDPHFMFGALAPMGLGGVANLFTAAQEADALYQNSLGNYKLSDPNANSFDYEQVYSIQNNTTITLNDHLKLVNIIGYRNTQQNQFSDFVGSATYSYLDSYSNSQGKLFTEELQLQGKFDKFNFVAGGYFFDENVDALFQDRVFGGLATLFPFLGAHLPLGGYFPNSYGTQSYSGFFHGTYDLSAVVPGLSITGGVRLTSETKTATLHDLNSFGVAFGQPVPAYLCEAPTVAEGGGQLFFSAAAGVAGCSQSLKLNDTEPTYNFSINYQATPTLLVYAGVSHGYRSGGFGVQAEESDPAQRGFRPEFITEGELGLKTDFHIGAMPVRLDGSGYYGAASNTQQLEALKTAAGSIVNSTANVAGENLYGAEFEVTAKPTPALQLTATYAYTRVVVTSWSDTYTPCFPATTGVCGAPVTLNISDSQIPYVPTHQWSVTARYTLPVPAQYGDVVFSATAYGQSSAFASNNNTANCGPDGYYTNCYTHGSTMPGYSLLNLRLDWTNVAGKGFDLAFFANNALNTAYDNAVFDLRGAIGVQTHIPGPPAMYGIQLKVPFGSMAH